MVAAYTCGTRLPARRALTLTGAAALVEAVAFVAPTGATGVGAVLTQLASSVITYLAASVVGGWIATRAGGHFATVWTHVDDLVESVRAITPSGATAGT